MTSLPDLLTLYRNDPRVARIAEGLQPDSARVQIAGTIGSAQALIAASVIDRTPSVHVFGLTDKEEAAYFINDLEALRGVSRTVEQPGKPSADRKHDDLFFYPAPSRSPCDIEGMSLAVHPHYAEDHALSATALQQAWTNALPGAWRAEARTRPNIYCAFVL